MFPTEARCDCGRLAAVDEREGRDAQGDDEGGVCDGQDRALVNG
jgi:hypothetical protein